MAEAGNKIGWKVTIIDGKGNASGWLSAWNQALALKPDGIISFVSADAVQAPIQEAKTMGIPVVGVLAASTPGPQPELGLFTNVSQDPASIGTAEAQYAIAKSNGTVRAVIVYDTLYAIARYKAEAMKKNSEVLGLQDFRLQNDSRCGATAKFRAIDFELGREVRIRADLDSHCGRRVRGLHGAAAARRWRQALRGHDRCGGWVPDGL